MAWAASAGIVSPMTDTILQMARMEAMVVVCTSEQIKYVDMHSGLDWIGKEKGGMRILSSPCIC